MSLEGRLNYLSVIVSDQMYNYVTAVLEANLAYNAMHDIRCRNTELFKENFIPNCHLDN